MSTGLAAIAASGLILFGPSFHFPAQATEAGQLALAALDEVIDQLPPVDEQWTWNKESAEWVCLPAALRLQSHVASGGTLSDEQWKRALLRSRVIRMRERWPADLPLAVCTEVPAWLSFVTQIRAAPTRPGLASAKAGRLVSAWGDSADAAWRGEQYQELGSLPLGRHELTFEIVVERGIERRSYSSRRGAAEPSGPPAVILWTGKLPLTVEIVPSLSAVLPSAHDEFLDSAVRRILDVDVFESGTNLVVRANRERGPELSTTALSFEIELLENGIEREAETLFVPDRAGWYDPAVGWNLPGPPAELSRWSIRVRGRATDVLRSWKAEHYWDGELEIPLTEAKRH